MPRIADLDSTLRRPPSFHLVAKKLEQVLSRARERSDFEAATEMCMATREAWMTFHHEFLLNGVPDQSKFNEFKVLLQEASNVVRNVKKFRGNDPSDREIVAKYAQSIEQRRKFVEILESDGITGLEERLNDLIAQPSEDTEEESSPDKHSVPHEVKLAFLSDEHYQWLLEDTDRLYSLTAAQFEQLVADRLSAMGFEVQLVGNSNAPDGGVDIVAWPKFSVPFPFLLAAQVKHHRSDRPTSVRAVRDFYGTLKVQDGIFSMGTIVTNTRFTDRAHWFAANSSAFLRLRELTDLCRWMSNGFVHPNEWKEIPSQIELAKGVIVEIPERQIWTPYDRPTPNKRMESNG